MSKPVANCRMQGDPGPGLTLPDGKHLRLLREADAAQLHALIETNRARLARWLPWAATQTPEDTREFIRKTEAQAAGNDGFQAAVIAVGQIAGVIGYLGVDWQHRKTGIGYWLGERYEGRGTMTEAVRALVGNALTVWDLNRVEIRVAAENRRSRAIPERLGFHCEGTLRQAERVGGRYLDSVVYSILAQEWREARPG